MRLNNPKKFVENGIDGSLIARGEIICQYTSDENISASTIWSNEFDLTSKWIRFSFDSGISFPIQYKLNQMYFSPREIVINSTNVIDSDDLEYTKCIKIDIDAEVYELIKNNPVGIFAKNGTRSTSLLAPVVYDDTNYTLSILLTEVFYNNNIDNVCIIKF